MPCVRDRRAGRMNATVPESPVGYDAVCAQALEYPPGYPVHEWNVHV